MKKSYPEHTTGNVMITDFFHTDSGKTIKQVINYLSKTKVNYEFMDYGYILNKKKELTGVFSIGDLFEYPQSTSIKKITKHNPIISVHPSSKGEVAAHTALRNKIKAIPVVEKGKMLGVIPPNRLLRIMHRSAQEDFLHMAGISKEHLDYENTMKVPIHKAVWHRAPWLLIGLVGIMIAAGFMGLFEEALEEYMILAYFIPAIVYLADALGSQHVTISVRDLASHGKDINKFRYFMRQTLIAVYLGLIISLGTFLTITIFWKQAYVGFVIAFALFVSAIITNLSSLLTTLGIYKLGKDPAFGSGPFATVISDVTSILVYLLIATIMLF